mmetsp:Transcript_67309/g.152291  ORF Transcript_67309/g.152291 Transcript_67309/m.152291 type:complete len:320 (+) Transcript_67309:2236-3195(+)
MTCAAVPTESPSEMLAAPLKLVGSVKVLFPAATAAPSVSVESNLPALTSKPGHAVSVGGIPANLSEVVPEARLSSPPMRAALLLEELLFSLPKSTSEAMREERVVQAAIPAASETATWVPSPAVEPRVPRLRPSMSFWAPLSSLSAWPLATLPMAPICRVMVSPDSSTVPDAPSMSPTIPLKSCCSPTGSRASAPEGELATEASDAMFLIDPSLSPTAAASPTKLEVRFFMKSLKLPSASASSPCRSRRRRRIIKLSARLPTWATRAVRVVPSRRSLMYATREMELASSGSPSGSTVSKLGLLLCGARFSSEVSAESES